MKYRFIRFPEGKEKAVTMSYDDGKITDIRFANIVSQYGIKCTFNLTGNYHLTKEQIEKHLLNKGHEIAVHGAEHKAETIVRPIEGIKDVIDCRLKLEKDFGVIVRGMAYPDKPLSGFANSAYYENISEYLKNLDIKYARTFGEENISFNIPEDWYAWMPTAHHNNSRIFELIDNFLNLDLSLKTHPAYRDARLFFIWGHSYEFERYNNWDRLEKICCKLSGKNDIYSVNYPNLMF